MGKNTKIEWCDHTFNPWRGCEHATGDSGEVHPACEHCYAESLSRRSPGVLGRWGDQDSGGTRIVARNAYWDMPLKWDQEAERAGERKRVFCASLADVFEDWTGPVSSYIDGAVHLNKEYRASSSPADRLTMDDVRRRLFALIDATPNLDWLLLTKRPENIQRKWVCRECKREGCNGSSPKLRRNVWLGTSISDQSTAERWIPPLLTCSHLASVLFVSAEPLLGPVDLRQLGTASGWMIDSLNGEWSRQESAGRDHPGAVESHGGWNRIGWVITGGESGPKARPMDPRWAMSIRDQCAAAGAAFFHKQNGEWAPNEVAAANPGWEACGHERVHVFPDRDEVVLKIGKKFAGRMLDGREWSEFPTGAPQ